MNVSKAANALVLNICRGRLPKTYMDSINVEAISEEHLLHTVEKICTGEVSGEKAHRRLGYIQGVLVAYNAATLDEMKKVNYDS